MLAKQIQFCDKLMEKVNQRLNTKTMNEQRIIMRGLNQT